MYVPTAASIVISFLLLELVTLSTATDDTETCGGRLSLLQTVLTLRQKPPSSTNMWQTTAGFPSESKITGSDLKTRLKSVDEEMAILLGDGPLNKEQDMMPLGDVTTQFVRPSLPVALTEVNSGYVSNMNRPMVQSAAGVVPLSRSGQPVPQLSPATFSSPQPLSALPSSRQLSVAPLSSAQLPPAPQLTSAPPNQGRPLDWPNLYADLHADEKVQVSSQLKKLLDVSWVQLQSSLLATDKTLKEQVKSLAEMREEQLQVKNLESALRGIDEELKERMRMLDGVEETGRDLSYFSAKVGEVGAAFAPYLQQWSQQGGGDGGNVVKEAEAFTQIAVLKKQLEMLRTRADRHHNGIMIQPAPVNVSLPLLLNTSKISIGSSNSSEMVAMVAENHSALAPSPSWMSWKMNVSKMWGLLKSPFGRTG